MSIDPFALVEPVEGCLLALFIVVSTLIAIVKLIRAEVESLRKRRPE